MGDPGVAGVEGRRSFSSSGLARGGRAGREGFFLTLGGVWVSVLEDCWRLRDFLMLSRRSGGGNCAEKVRISFLGLELDFFLPKSLPRTDPFRSIFFGLSSSISSSASSFLELSVSSLNSFASFLESRNEPPFANVFCTLLDILKD